MILVDAGYFIALFTPDDELHERAIAWSAHVNEPLVVTEYVLLECVNKFSRPKDRPSAHALVEHVRTNPIFDLVHASAQLFADGLSLHRDRPDKEWSLTDCISFTVMTERKIGRALAYDRSFRASRLRSSLAQRPTASLIPRNAPAQEYRRYALTEPATRTIQSPQTFM